MSAPIFVKALEHVFGCNPDEVFALSVEQYEQEMRRARPRVSPVNAPPRSSPLAPPEPPAVEAAAPAVMADRQARPRRARGER